MSVQDQDVEIKGITEVKYGQKSDQGQSEYVSLSDKIHVCSGQDASEGIPVLTCDSASDETFMTGDLSISREFVHWESSGDDIIIMEPKNSLEITRQFFPRVNIPFLKFQTHLLILRYLHLVNI